MKKEIGGYFELEQFSGQEYYPDLYKVNLGRTALRWLLEDRGCRRILLPYYLCDSVTEVCRQMEIEVDFYSLDENVRPMVVQEKLPEHTYLYLVNYYGQLTDEKILAYREIYGNIIVDHTQAFYQKPLPGIDTIYSCRKYFGVSDGAYLSTDAVLDGNKKRDESRDRMEHILGRYEEDAGTYYKKMLDNAHTYERMDIRLMSYLTQNYLRAIPYEEIKRKREENYKLLAELLPSRHVFTEVFPEGAFAYPYYCSSGIELRRWLAQQKIFVPVYWSNVLQQMPENSREYQWAANILALPCDQRYGKEEMMYIAERIRQWEREEAK